MLKQRVITAIILLVLFLLALFVLPGAGWAALVIVMVLQGAAEWSQLAGFSHRSAHLFWWLTLAMMLALFWFDTTHPAPGQQAWLHLTVYAMSAVLWLASCPPG